MSLRELFKTYNLDHSLLIGYYGGGNYGDELLLEVLANLLQKEDVTNISITHQDPERYNLFHHDFGYPLVAMNNKSALLRAILNHKNLIIGGGGLWGLDSNLNIFLLSFMLFVSRFLLGKNVFLLGVGYYNSTSRLGRMSAWFAGKAATHIIARDAETFDNFQNITKQVSLDEDIAWHIPELDLTPYAADLKKLETQLTVKENSTFITLRRFKASQRNGYANIIERYIEYNPKKPLIVSLMEPSYVDSKGYARIQSWAARYKNIQAIDFSYNPLALYMFFQKYHEKLTLVGPQFHIIITARMTNVPFLSIAYDNKVARLLEHLELQPIPITELSHKKLQSFIGEQAA